MFHEFEQVEIIFNCSWLLLLHCCCLLFFSFAYNNLFILLQLRSFQLFMCFIFSVSYDNIVVFYGHFFSFVSLVCIIFCFLENYVQKDLKSLFKFSFILFQCVIYLFTFFCIRFTLSIFEFFFVHFAASSVNNFVVVVVILFAFHLFFIFLLLLLLVSGFFPIDKLNKGNIELNRYNRECINEMRNNERSGKTITSWEWVYYFLYVFTKCTQHSNWFSINC